MPDLRDLDRLPPNVRRVAELGVLDPARLLAASEALRIASVSELEHAGRTNRLRDLQGFGADLQASVLRGLRDGRLWPKGRLLDAGRALASRVLGLLQRNDTSLRLAVAGQVRRMEPVVTRVDLVATALEPPVLLEALANTPSAEEVLDRGPDWVEVRVEEGLPVRLDVLGTEEDFRTRLAERTGTPPEAEGLLAMGDVRGVMHAQTSAGRGSHSAGEMAQRALREGFTWIALTDRAGATPDVPRSEEVAEVVRGVEAEILADGRLDRPDEALAEYDLVVAAVHDPRGPDGRPLSERAMTDRLVRAVSHPRVHVLAHPRGRILLAHDGPPMDLGRVLDACAEHGVAVEVSGDPHRLDLPEAWHAEARRRGLKAAVAADAYDLAGIDQAILAVGTARRGGWRRDEVISAMEAEEVRDWCRAKTARSLS